MEHLGPQGDRGHYNPLYIQGPWGDSYYSCWGVTNATAIGVLKIHASLPSENLPSASAILKAIPPCGANTIATATIVAPRTAFLLHSLA